MPNSIYFQSPNDDPIFGAHAIKNNLSLTDGETVTYYDSDRFANILGCAEQYQLCMPADDDSRGQENVNSTQQQDRCTPLTTSRSLLSNAQSHPLISTNPFRLLVSSRISLLANPANLYTTIDSRGGASLRAQETVSHLLQGPLSSTHWHLEVQSWFDSGLAYIQRGILEYVTGPTNVDVTGAGGAYVYKPTDSISRAMCHSQLVRSSNGTVSFSIVGVSIILILGTLIIGTSLILEKIVSWFQTRNSPSSGSTRSSGGLFATFKKSTSDSSDSGPPAESTTTISKASHRNTAWILDETFQLQRMLFEAKGIPNTEDGGGKWVGVRDNVPTTTLEMHEDENENEEDGYGGSNKKKKKGKTPTWVGFTDDGDSHGAGEEVERIGLLVGREKGVGR